MGQCDGTAGVTLEEYAETLYESRTSLAVSVGLLAGSPHQERVWRSLERLDFLLDELVSDLDPAWGVTERIADRWSPAGIPHGPAAWTDPEPPAPADGRRRVR